MGRPTKENSLSRQDVINAAIRCVDQQGAGALGVSQVARSLGIKPPAIYRHLDSGAHLARATAIELWHRYLADCQQALAGKDITPALLQQLGFFTRNFAKEYPGRYQTMMQVQLSPSDSEAAIIIHGSLGFLRQALCAYDLTETQLIDVMRMINSAIYGFISLEQSGQMTLEHSTDESYSVMLDALVAAVRHIQKKDNR
ncbi:MAG: TetR/AcrR family transcriptional regulator [Thermosynechococcaceae cyanobacterium]